MAAVIYEQTGGTSSTTSNSSNSSSTSSTNFRCTDSLSQHPVQLHWLQPMQLHLQHYPSSSSLHGNNKSNHLHPSSSYSKWKIIIIITMVNIFILQRMIMVTSSVTAPNGYWPYSTQPYFPSTARQYMITQPPSSCPITPTGVSDTSSSSSQQDLSYHTHGSYPTYAKNGW